MDTLICHSYTTRVPNSKVFKSSKLSADEIDKLESIKKKVLWMKSCKVN